MIEIGNKSSISRIFEERDIRSYAEQSGAKSINSKWVPEPLIGGLFSYLLGVELPGKGTMYLKQETQFLDRAAPGEALKATVEITNLRPDKKLIDLKTSCENEEGTLIAEGRALIYLDRSDFKA